MRGRFDIQDLESWAQESEKLVCCVTGCTIDSWFQNQELQRTRRSAAHEECADWKSTKISMREWVRQ